MDERLYSLCKSNVRVTVVDPPAHCSSPEDNAADRSPELPPELVSSGGGAPQGQLNKAQRQISEESLNPFLAFSTEDLQGRRREMLDTMTISASPFVWLYKVNFLEKVLFQYRNFEMNLHQLVKKYCQKSHYKRSKQDHKNV